MKSSGDVVDFENLKNAFELPNKTIMREFASEMESLVSKANSEKQLAFEFKSEADELRQHFLRFPPEGYSKESIEEMNDEEILALKVVYDNHCF